MKCTQTVDSRATVEMPFAETRAGQGRIQKMNLEGANSGCLGDGSPEADNISQLKGYLDVLWRDVKR